MKTSLPLLPKLSLAIAVALAASALPTFAIDHDNVDSGRPLDFDDAEAIAFREKAIEFGAAIGRPRGGKTEIHTEAEFLYGFARNWHLNLGVDPEWTADAGGRRRISVGDVNVGVQHNLNRETESMPAFGLRADAVLPTGRGSSGIDLRLRGMASRQFGAFGRLHLNTDLNLNNSPQPGERRVLPGVILGYSRPLGYPTRFDRTMVAQLGWRAAPERGANSLVNVGIGLRQQVTPRSVFDVGIKTDIAGGGRERERFRVIAGYSTAF